MYLDIVLYVLDMIYFIIQQFLEGFIIYQALSSILHSIFHINIIITLNIDIMYILQIRNKGLANLNNIPIKQLIRNQSQYFDTDHSLDRIQTFSQVWKRVSKASTIFNKKFLWNIYLSQILAISLNKHILSTYCILSIMQILALKSQHHGYRGKKCKHIGNYIG